MKKNKSAFTLAEVLVTLVIIGVVAALTVPSVQLYVRDVQYVNSLKKFYANTNQAFKLRMSKDGVTDFRRSAIIESISGTNLNSGNQSRFSNEMRKAFKTIAIFEKGQYGGNKACAYQYESGGTNNDNYTVILADGTIMRLDLTTQPQESALTMTEIRALTGHMKYLLGTIDVDVNGDNPPNKWGLDCYRFVLAQDGMIYPYMGKDYAIFKAGSGWESSQYYWNGSYDECLVEGLSCAARIMHDEWVMTYRSSKKLKSNQ
ncbi:type II secretion system protein [bacterium]|nr:type II secretion system protein [bacterium]